MQREGEERPKSAVIAAVQLPNVSDVEFDASVSELRALAKTLGFEVIRTFTQKRSSFDATAYLGLGKRQELRRFVHNEGEPDQASHSPPARSGTGSDDAATDAGIHVDAIFVDHEISPSQARNLEIEIGCETPEISFFGVPPNTGT